MSSIIADGLSAPDELLTAEQAAAFLKISPKTLERLRGTGEGPKFLKAGGSKRSRVLYTRKALTEWLQKFSYRSTSEYR